MKKFFFAAVSAAILFSCSNKKEEKKDEKTNGTEKTADKATNDKTASTPMPDSATMMKNWQEYMTPGEMHKMMAKWDGTWNADITTWDVPGAPAKKSNGTCVNKMIMNGLYQESNHTSVMMDMPFTGKGILGYNNHKKMFVLSWIDNMGSGIMNLEGPWDEATKSVTLKGTITDAGTKMPTEMKEVFKVVDDNTQMMEMYMNMEGKEFKWMEIKYTRK